MKNVKMIALSAAAAGALMSASAMAELAGNFGVTSNYMWRGVTQANDQAAVSGGIDYSHESGAYVGAWVSNLDNGAYEQDIYLGYAGEAGAIRYDAGYILYMYPLDTSVTGIDFSEVYVGLGYGSFGLDVAFTVDSDAGGDDSDVYYAVSGNFEVGKELGLGIVIGSYDFDAAATEDYTHYQVSLSKGDFTFAMDKNDMSTTPDDEMRVSISWAQKFEM